MKIDLVATVANNKIKSDKIVPTFVRQASEPGVELSEQARKLVKNAHALIEDTWVQIKKKEVKMESPIFSESIARGQSVTLSPLYNGQERSIVLQISDPKGYQRVSVAQNAKDFTYERVVKTKCGLATTSSHNSKISPKNRSMTITVSDLLEIYLPKFVSAHKF